MAALVQALYWLSLSAWFGAALFSVVAPPIILRVIRAADPTLPRILSVNLDRQHSTLLASQVAGEVLLTLFRIQAACAVVFAPALLGQWQVVNRGGAGVLLPLIVTALYVVAGAFVVYGWRAVWPKVVLHRAAYVEHADDPDKANPELDQFDRYSHELLAVVRNLVFALLGIVLFSASFVPYAQALASN
jgi:hypothetical protein